MGFVEPRRVSGKFGVGVREHPGHDLRVPHQHGRVLLGEQISGGEAYHRVGVFQAAQERLWEVLFYLAALDLREPSDGPWGGARTRDTAAGRTST